MHKYVGSRESILEVDRWFTYGEIDTGNLKLKIEDVDSEALYSLITACAYPEDSVSF